MPIGLIFWSSCSGSSRHLAVTGGPNYPWASPAGDIIILILFFILGWHDFGSIVRP